MYLVKIEQDISILFSNNYLDINLKNIIKLNQDDCLNINSFPHITKNKNIIKLFYCNQIHSKYKQDEKLLKI